MFSGTCCGTLGLSDTRTMQDRIPAAAAMLNSPSEFICAIELWAASRRMSLVSFSKSLET
jgi:hypothetical protein